MNANAFTEVEFSQVMELLRTACTVAAVAIISRRLVEAQTDSERQLLAETLLKIVGVDRPRPRIDRDMFEDEEMMQSMYQPQFK